MVSPVIFSNVNIKYSNNLHTPSYNPADYIKLNEVVECGVNRKEGVVSVHDYFKYESIEILGWIDINNNLTNYYSSEAFTNFTVRETNTMTSTVSLNFTKEFSYNEQNKCQ